MYIDWREIPGRYIKDPRLGHRLGRNYPAGEITDQEWNHRWLGTDSEGFIYNNSPARDWATSDTSYQRVFLLGGSTMAGIGVDSNSNTIASALESFLQRNEPNARTLNCACGAYNSWQQLVYLSLELIVHKPDVVIVMDGWNDFIHSSFGNKNNHGKWIPNSHRSLDDINGLIQTASGDTSILEFLMKKLRKIPLISELQYRGRYGFQAGVWSHSDFREWSYKPHAVDYYICNVKSIIGLATSNGAKVIYLYQPQLLWGNRVPTNEESAFIEKITKRMPPIPELAPQWHTDAQKEFQKLVQEKHDGRSVWVEDASSWLNEISDTVYHDYNHYNQLGQRLIAERMGSIVMKLWTEKSGPRLAQTSPHP